MFYKKNVKNAQSHNREIVVEHCICRLHWQLNCNETTQMDRLMLQSDECAFFIPFRFSFFFFFSCANSANECIILSCAYFSDIHEHFVNVFVDVVVAHVHERHNFETTQKESEQIIKMHSMHADDS